MTTTIEQPEQLVVVGIGASAGGLESFKTFFTNLPSNPGMAFVCVQHLDPDHKSVMADLLQNYTPMPVNLAEDGMSVEPDNVYLIPPNASLTIENDHLRVARPAPPRGHRTPIDVFLKSLAEERGAGAVGIILSGTGSDGSLGVRAIKEAGGATMAEASETAKYDGMPRSAVGTGLVDWVLPTSRMPETLLAYVDNRRRLHDSRDLNELQAQTEAQLGKVLSALQSNSGHDFKGYKESTLMRRIWRRMQVCGIDDVSVYVEKLRQDPDEAQRLFKDLLIGVTYFFREPAAWAAVTELVLPALFKGRDGTTVRIWVTGCATGEEAYTLAILLSEYLDDRGVQVPVQIFATDIDDAAIGVARRGAYPHSIAADVTPERLARYFRRTSDQYIVAERLRETCVFSNHNLVKDPPFSRLDLISCRNLLIYMGTKLQERVFPLLHYALLPHGFLLLGAAEGIASATQLFGTIDKKHRIFKRRKVRHRAVTDFPMVPQLHHPRVRPLRNGDQAEARPPLKSVVEQALLSDYAPPTVLVYGNGDAAYFFGDTSRYIAQPAGAPSLNLIQLARPALRSELRTLLHRASSRGETTVRERVDVVTEGERRSVRVVVRPMDEMQPDEGMLRVSFEPVAEPVALVDRKRDREEAEEVTANLERELEATKEHLQSTIEELETQGEELRSSNEELMSMNEELQASNEELETAKEELQSVNEELETVNAELKTRVEDLARANGDLRNLFESTRIATIFLDPSQRIQSFTPAVAEIFDLVDGDQGRPIKAFAHRFYHENLSARLEAVLREETPSEEDVVTPDGKCFVMRVNPYRAATGVAAGLVLTFIDVTLNRRDARRQQLVAELGVKALARLDVRSVISEAAQILQAEVGADMTEILKLDPEADRLSFMAGAGWEAARAEGHDQPLEKGSQRAFTLQSDTAVICNDLSAEARFRPSELLAQCGVESSACLPLPNGTGAPYGLLCVHARKKGAILAEDLPFMRAVANVIATALQRGELEAAELKQQEARVRSESGAQLRRAERLASIGTFAAGIAHEINNPVNNILISAQYAQRTRDTKTRSQMLDQIVGNARRCRPIIESVLRLAREEESDKWPCDVVELVRRARDLLLGRSDVSAEIEIDAKDHLPPVIGNPTELENATFNLLKNAAAASGPTQKVVVRVTHSNRSIRIEVRDHGAGIQEEDLDRIFDPFFSRRRSKGGTGLGLSLVQAIVSGHGGTIHASNAPDGGAIFTIDLPAVGVE